MSSVIRIAEPHDAAPLAALARESFIDTYAAFNTAQDMNLHLQRSYSEPIQGQEIANVSMLTMLAENQGQLTGFAQGHFSKPPPCLATLNPPPKRPWEILRFYIHRDWHGRGIARLLMDNTLEAARAREADHVWLSVWNRNARAQAFYRKCGFEQIGATTFTLGNDVQHDFVMGRDLAAIAA